MSTLDSTTTTSVGIVAGAIVLALVLYALARAIIAPRLSDDTKPLASSVIARIGVLHGLILAVVFAAQLYQYYELREDVRREAEAVSNLSSSMQLYGAPQDTVDRFEARLADYVHNVTTREWRNLGTARTLSVQAKFAGALIQETLLDLHPQSPRQETLRASMVEDLKTVNRLRHERLAAANQVLSPFVWIAAILGFSLMSVLFGIYRITPLSVSCVAAFAVYNGVVFALIHGLAHPFDPPANLSPAPFELLLDGPLGTLVSSPSGAPAGPAEAGAVSAN